MARDVLVRVKMGVWKGHDGSRRAWPLADRKTLALRSCADRARNPPLPHCSLMARLLGLRSQKELRFDLHSNTEGLGKDADESRFRHRYHRATAQFPVRNSSFRVAMLCQSRSSSSLRCSGKCSGQKLSPRAGAVMRRWSSDNDQPGRSFGI